MNPGRELDRLIAEKVMGHTVYETDDCNGIDNLWLDKHAENELPSYSRYMSHAWLVVEKLDLLKYSSLQKNRTGCWGVWNDHDVVLGQTAAHAICLAALETVK